MIIVLFMGGAFAVRAMMVIIHTSVPSSWCLTFLGFSMLTALCWRARGPKAVMVNKGGKQGATWERVWVEDWKGTLTIPFSGELPPFSATLLICPLCGLQTSLLNSLKMRPFSFYHDKPEWARECINCLNWRGHSISETVKTSKTNDNLPYR